MTFGERLIARITRNRSPDVIIGPRIREWGFYCMERGWVHWKRFTTPGDPGTTGAGCDAD